MCMHESFFHFRQTCWLLSQSVLFEPLLQVINHDHYQTILTDRYQNTANGRLGICSSYAVGKWVCSILYAGIPADRNCLAV